MVGIIPNSLRLVSSLLGNPDMPTDAEAVALEAMTPKPVVGSVVNNNSEDNGKSKRLPIKISNDASYTKDEGVTYNRTEIDAEIASFTHDIKEGPGSRDVSQLEFMLVNKDSLPTWMFNVTREGKLNENPEGMPEYVSTGEPRYILYATKVFAKKKGKDISALTLTAGKMTEGGDHPDLLLHQGQPYPAITYGNMNTTGPNGQAGVGISSADKGEKETGIPNAMWAYGGLDLADLVYAAGGARETNKSNTNVMALGTHNIGDFGFFYLHENDAQDTPLSPFDNTKETVRFKMAGINVSDDIFSKENYDENVRNSLLPVFVKPRYDSHLTNGGVTLEFYTNKDVINVEHKETVDLGAGQMTYTIPLRFINQETESKVGVSLGDWGNFGFGEYYKSVNTPLEKSDEKSVVGSYANQIDFNIGKTPIDLYIDASYDKVRGLEGRARLSIDL